MIENISRRGVLGGLLSVGALVIAARVLPGAMRAGGPLAWRSRADEAAFHPSVYLGLEPDGRVIVVVHRSEMGTGIRSTLAMVAAEELEADWSRVTIEQAIGDARYGNQNTDGSCSVRDFYHAFRVAGATARVMLIEAAAAAWRVPAGECTAERHEIVHLTTGRREGFGALAAAAARLPVPKPDTLVFKPQSSWRLLGQARATYDLKDIVTGKAQFGADIVRDRMVFASIEHPPVFGGTVKTVDDAAARAVRGVSGIERMDPISSPYLFKPLGGVAVIGDSTWAVLQGRKKLVVQWDDGRHASFESKAFEQELRKTVAQPGKVARNVGDVDAVFNAKTGPQAPARIVEATYYTPLLAHAAMEPLVAVAEYQDGAVTMWAPTQNPQAVQEAVGGALGIDKARVTCHVTLLGGAFGRKSKPDYCVEAAVLSKRLGRPVKVVWTREDDTRGDYYHSTAAVHHKAALDARGRPTAWLQRSVFPPIESMFVADARHASPMELQLGLTDLPFDVPNIRAENGPAEAHIRIGWFRAVANNYHAFAAHSFADELAHAAGRDPLEYLLEMLGPGRILDLKAEGTEYPNYGASTDLFPIDTKRLRHVLEVAGERAGWASRPKGHGRGMGIAAHRSFSTYVASVVHVEVDENGRVRVPRIDQVVDAGLILNPDRVRAQFEGAAVMAAGVVMSGAITVEGGRVQQSNFHDFQVPRMHDAPRETRVHLIESSAPPGGVGEPGVPPVIAAFANAIFAATGTRVRELPLTRHTLSRSSSAASSRSSTSTPRSS